MMAETTPNAKSLAQDPDNRSGIFQRGHRAGDNKHNQANQ